MPTSIPQPIFGVKGFSSPDESTDIFPAALADLNTAFGGGLNVTTVSTPQGQLATTLSAIVGDKNDQFLQYINGVDPQFASGRMQDGIGRIYFISRIPASPTTVQCNCVGTRNVTIPIGTRARAIDGNIYISTTSGTIDYTGTISLTFACVTNGPIPLSAHTLNQIYDNIPGWDTIDNPLPGIIGTALETSQQFEQRRAATVSKASIGSLASVLANILSVPAVNDAYVVQNSTSIAKIIGGINVLPHSLYASVSGGDPHAIGAAILASKSIGCDITPGNTTVVLSDTSYARPYPTYTINYQTAISTPIWVYVSIINSNLVPNDALTQIQNAVISAFSGADGGSRARIGGTLLSSRFYAPIASLGPWAQVYTITLGTSGGAGNFQSIILPINQIPTISASNIGLTLV